MFRHARHCVALILVLSCSVPAYAAKKTLLRFRPVPESSLPYTMTTESDIELAMGAMGAQQMSNNAVIDLHLGVVEVDESGDVTLDVVYDRFRIEAKSFGQTVVFDSKEPASGNGSEEMGEVFAKMTGQAIRLEVDERGKVKEVAGLDAIFEEMAGNPAADPRAAPIMEILRGSFSDQAIQGLMQQALVMFPEKAVSPGESWKGSIATTNPMVGGLQADYTYRYEGREEHRGKDSVRLDFDLALTHDGTTPLLDQMVQMFRAQGSEVDVALDINGATGSGTVWLEPATGMPVELEMTQKMDVGINIELNMSGQPQTMNMQMKMDTRTSMKRSDAGPTTTTSAK